jgi:hypothetical protein
MLFRIVLALGLAAFFCGSSSAQIKPKVTRLDAEPTSILYIGNSYFYFNNGVDSLVQGLHAAAEPGQPLGGGMVTIAGAGWKWHDVGSYFRPDAMNSFTLNNGSVSFNDTTGKLFDTAVMMDCSYCTINPDLRKVFFEYAKRHSATVRQHGAVPVFFMTWAYADRPEMTDQIAQAYTQAGNDNDVLVIPVALAFARVKRDRPDIELNIFDKQHPTLAGSYLAACTIFSSLFGRSPAGLKYEGGVPRSVARRLQEAAWATVQEYYGR